MLFVLVCTGLTHPSLAESQADVEGVIPHSETWDRTIPLKKDWALTLIPAGDLYPKYIADPLRTNFSITRMFFSESDIMDTGNSRLGLRLGGRYGFLRLHKQGDPDYGIQLDIEAGFIGQFDLDNSTDNIGWDGIYGIQMAWAHRSGLAVRMGAFHDSSHVGDEYAERTGRLRIEYTREEYLLGVSWSFMERWRTYVEGGYAYDIRNEKVMNPERIQYGLEYQSPASLWKGRLGWYAATDVSSFEENDWDQNVTAQIGLLFPVKDLTRSYRFGIEYYNGRSHIGEFFQNDERYLLFGFWFDL